AVDLSTWPLRLDVRYETVTDCVTILLFLRSPGYNVYVGHLAWSNFSATKCRGLVSLNQVIKEIICLQPLMLGDLCLVLLLAVLLLLLLRSDEWFNWNAETAVVFCLLLENNIIDTTISHNS